MIPAPVLLFRALLRMRGRDAVAGQGSANAQGNANWDVSASSPRNKWICASNQRPLQERKSRFSSASSSKLASCSDGGDNVPVHVMDSGTVREHRLFTEHMRVIMLKYCLDLK